MEYILTVSLATISGVAARFYMLRRDYRQYPSYPQGWAIHLFIGFIGALLGAILVPSFIEREFTAVSFLLMAASQFREVRSVERDTLANMEPTEMVKRGTAYIEGIARVFEARNYLAIWTAFVVAIIAESCSNLSLTWQILLPIIAGMVFAAVLNILMQGSSIGDIADIKSTDIEFDGPILVVGGIHVMNVGLKSAQAVYHEKAVAAEIIPKTVEGKATLTNIGQMQAIAHDVSSMVGVYMDVGEQEFTPLVRRDPESGKLVIVMVPSDDNEGAFLEAISNVPVLEGAIKKPLRSVAGRMVDGG